MIAALKVNEASVVFVDSPVGSGYSYVDQSSLLTSDIQQIADDLTQFTRQFMIRYPQFKVCVRRHSLFDHSIDVRVVLTHIVYIKRLSSASQQCRLLQLNATDAIAARSIRPSVRLSVCISVIRASS